MALGGGGFLDIMELLDKMERLMNVNTSSDFTPDGITMHFLDTECNAQAPLDTPTNNRSYARVGRTIEVRSFSRIPRRP